MTESRRDRAVGDQPDTFVTSRLSTDGTKYLQETYESTDGTVELPWPMIDPQTGVANKFTTDWPIGDARREEHPHPQVKAGRKPAGAAAVPPIS